MRNTPIKAATFPVVFRLLAPMRTTQPGANALGSLALKSCKAAPSCTEKVSVKEVELSPVSVAGDVADGSTVDSFIAVGNIVRGSAFIALRSAMPETDHEDLEA